MDHLVRRSVWIVGGDGWAYDIGSGGLDHVLASGRNVNVLVLDTEVYSNTGGQMSKATPLGAVAKFAAAGKTVPKKDLALQAIAYGSVYVARVAMGSDPQQTLEAFREAEAYDGPSLVIAYSHCIAHGIEMRNGLDQQYRAVASGYWPLIRYDPMARAAGGNPFLLDSPRPRIPLADYTNRELRYRTLANTDPAEAERLHGLAEQAVAQRWEVYEEMATRGAHRFPADARKDRLMELSTDYMGLALRNPLVASASPLSKTVDGVRRLADAGVGAVVLYSLFEEQLRSEAALNARAGRRRHRELRRVAVVLPGRGRGGARPAPLPEPARARRGRRRRSGDRQPQRRHARRLGRLRPGDAGRRRGRDRAEHLLPSRRPAHLRPRGRAAPHRRPARGSRTR